MIPIQRKRSGGGYLKKGVGYEHIAQRIKCRQPVRVVIHSKERITLITEPTRNLDCIWDEASVNHQNVGVFVMPLLLSRRPAIDRARVWMGIAIAIIWLAVALTSIFTPELVTGTDPTRVPIAAIISPVVGAIGTGIVCGFVWLLARGS